MIRISFRRRERGAGGRWRRRASIFVGCWLLLGAAVPWTVRADPFEPVGHTTATYLGDTGVLEFTLACQVDFGPSARMCTSAEVIGVLPLPAGFVDDAWVRPVIGSGPMNSPYDVSGQPFFSCLSWTSAGAAGLTMTATGGFLNQAGDEPRPVACCTPVPEPSQLLSLVSGAAFIALLARRRRVRLDA